MANDIIDTHQQKAEAAQSRGDAQEPIFVTGVPYIHPSFTFSKGAADQLDSWDRVVLFGGGCVLGVSFGAAATLLVISLHGDSAKIGLLLCSLMIALNAVVCFTLQFRTERMISSFSRLLNERTVRP